MLPLLLHVLCVQVSLAQKDALLSQLAQHKAAMEARLGLTGGADGADAAAVAAAAVAARRGSDYVPREQHEQLEVELATVKEQLVETLEELNSRELELTEVRASFWLVLVFTSKFPCCLPAQAQASWLVR